MARYQMHHILELQDISGDRAIMKIPNLSVGDTATLATLATTTAAIVTALGAPGTITNAKVVSTGISVQFTEVDPLAAPVPLDAEFPSVADKALLTFTSATGSRTRNAIPAPIEGIFHAPPADDTVDPASAIAAWLTEFETVSGDAGNVVYGIYTGGVRQKARARRRRTHRH